jgi:hypothetical protein
VTDEPWGYADWLPGEPNDPGEPYLHYWLESAQWNDINPNFVGPFICEWEADCNADGIVDYGQILDGTLIDLDGDGVPDSCEAATGELLM